MPQCSIIPREFAGSYALGREPVLGGTALHASGSSKAKRPPLQLARRPFRRSDYQPWEPSDE
jgi:hypothetical protein